MVQTLKRVADAPWFQHAVTAMILIAGVLVGIETYPSMIEAYGRWLHLANNVVLAVFVAEIVVKMGSEGSQWHRYFRDPWNGFDFAIVAVCFLPIGAEGVAVLRLARLLRVLKLVRALPKLQILVSALLKSIPSMGYVTLLLLLLFYLYAVAAVMFFGTNDPVHFGELGIAMLSLFRIVTLEGWTELLYIQMYGCATYGYDTWPGMCTASEASPLFAPLFFISFVLLGTMVVLNLFVGVIMSGMEEAQEEQREAMRLEELRHHVTLEGEVAALQHQLAQIGEQLERVRIAAAAHGKAPPAPRELQQVSAK